ncbi:Cof-type HAD-IIB family hydrolase [Spiroplasma endosymbiont of Amphibalanus improvisus]|uniref:Cof-type HAD-IIB family hydrolase n=1 Tax=Spiroplasma endosymbiont of Amphibalanus improvisus TaxID=3066327 RepID=UPI00313AB426
MEIKNDKKRLILIDLDGTTLKNDGKSIHQKTKNAIGKAVEFGHHVCIITGRPHRASIRFYKELELNTLLTNFDGGHIHDPLKQEFKRIVMPISNEIIMDIINEEVIKKSLDNILIEYFDRAMCLKNDSWIETYFHLDNIADDNYWIKDPYKEWTGPATDIAITLKNNVEMDDVLRVLGSYHKSIKINITNNSNKKIIILTNKLVSKGRSAEILAQYYNVELKDAIAFGDEINDLEMMQMVGYPVGMKNGNPALKSICRSITYLTNDEGGVGDFLDKTLFKNKKTN